MDVTDDKIYCKLFGHEIDIGLCADIVGVSSRMLRKDAVPEIDRFTAEEIQVACNNCPYV